MQDQTVIDGAARPTPVPPPADGCHGKRNGRDQQVVMRLFDAILDNDHDRILSFFSDDTVFKPLTSAPVVGHAAIWGALQGSGETIERQLHRVTPTGDGCVRTERTERHLRNGGWREVQVTSTFAVRGCKIAHWHDTRSAD
jgi:limonene-1,2-epoxide hydrolase